MADRRYWFPAKRYGWGWGFPSSWQGWVVFALYGASIPIGAYLFLPHQEVGFFLLFTAAVTIALVAVCYLKGEPPSWRWGD